MRDRSEGYEVASLKRVRVVNIELGDLKSGEYRELSQGEMKGLYEKCGLKQK